MPLYFAYGSNMDVAAMRRRCPSSHAIGLGRLLRHRFVLTREGYASVIRDPGACVHGLLWDLALRDTGALDRYEGVADGLYAKAYQPIATAAGSRRALLYVGLNSGPGVVRPGYMEGVIAAAESLRLPAPYVARLRELLQQPGVAAGSKP